MKKITTSLIVLTVILSTGTVSANPVLWDSSVGGNDHLYELVLAPVNWLDAEALANSSSYNGFPGHLATITSEEENSFIYQSLLIGTNKRPWIGGFQGPDASEPAGDWQWVTGEVWGYSNWWGVEPNDLNNEDSLVYNWIEGTWNDGPTYHIYGRGGYIVEYEPDTDNDGVFDSADSCPLDPDNDIDTDGICGNEDNCVETANANQSDIDLDGLGDACDDDDDGDGVLDGIDNCQYDYNSDQIDTDGDGEGDVCDTDDDNDGVLDADDQCFGVTFDVVNSNGCSVDQLCPCNNNWKNHGAFVRCVAHASEDFVAEGLITEVEKDFIVSEAANSECGHKK